MEWSLSAVLLPIIFGIVGGIFANILQRWTLHRITLDLDYRLSDLEGRVNREVKIRAGSEVAVRKKAEQMILDAAKEQAPQNNPSANLSSWISKQYQRK